MWPRTAAGGPNPVPGGCLSEADRIGRCGGSISVFLGDGGLGVEVGCVGDRNGALRGDGGLNVGGAAFAEEALVLVVDATLNVLGRIRLSRRVGADALVTVVAESCLSPPVAACGSPLGDVSPRCGSLLSGG